MCLHVGNFAVMSFRNLEKKRYEITSTEVIYAKFASSSLVP